MSSQQPTSATYACIRCWRLKKKCDKELPQCKRCVAARFTCEYSSQPPTGRDAARKPPEESTTTSATTSEDWLQKKSPPSLFNAATSYPPSPPESEDTISEHSYHNRSRLTIYSAYHRVRDELPEILRVFSLSTNIWLPFLNENEINQLKGLDGSTPEVETIILLLSIYLVTKEPPEGGTLENIYTVAKQCHLNLHTSNGPAGLIIQSGMLLAMYEQGQALHLVSGMTLGSMIRLAQLSGFHKTININLEAAGPSRETLEEQRRVWWVLVVLERVLTLQPLDDYAPFAAPSPKLTDYLPSTWSTTKDADGGCEIGRLINNEAGHQDVQFPLTNPFGESVQSAFLLSEVFQHFNNTGLSPQQRAQDVDRLDGVLHTYMTQALADVRRQDKTWHQCCIAFYICVCSRFRLHIHNLKHTTSLSAQNSRRKSAEVLYWIAKIGTESKDTAQSLGKNDLFMKEGNMPPFTLSAGRDTAFVSLEMIRNPMEGVGNEAFWRELLVFYKGSFEVGRRKWRLAVDYMALVQQQEEALTTR